MSRFLFPRWINKLVTLAGGLLLCGAGYAGVFLLGATDDVTLNPGYQPDQPVPFSHKIHAGELKMDCRYCHVNVEKSAFATVPPTATCINCHSPIGVDGGTPQFSSVRSGSEKLRAVHESWESGESIPWVRIHRLPDYVFFNHSAHVSRGVSCVSCHGRIDTMDKVYQAKELSMAWCISCHSSPDSHLRSPELITKLDWLPEGAEGKSEAEVTAMKAEIGAELRKANGIHPKTNCAVCHR
ncbi:MAG: cytochrome c3 family protein [Planctomycetales bacterium]|nr:cytochrome c3 family protein [Planctomycetales bacterium]